MAQRSRDILKQWFETGDYPTQQQFADLIDSCFNKADDKMAIENIENLLQILQGKADGNGSVDMGKETKVYNADDTYTIKAGIKLESIIVLPANTLSAFRVGKSAGLSDILPPVEDDPFVAGEAKEIFLNLYAIADREIYLQGILPNTTIIFYKR